jgi:hypothetical protein
MQIAPPQNVSLRSLTRYFTRKDMSPYELIDFDSCNGFDRPTNWSPEATQLFADLAACKKVPSRLTAIEENTVPSWLWRHKANGVAAVTEDSVRQIFDRIVGCAVYQGWKSSLFANESDSQTFYDELRYILSQRFLVIEPARLAAIGVNWAYGLRSEKTLPITLVRDENVIDIDNQTIDTVVSGRTTATARKSWQQALAQRAGTHPVKLRFVDTIKEWGASSTAETLSSAAAIDLLALRHNDGSLNIDAVKHVVRLAVILLDLIDAGSHQLQPIGYFNIAPLLMSMAIAYDSQEGRATAAAISAIVTAEAYSVSAELAKLCGQHPDYATHIGTIMRSLRNHCRAAYGDQTDYERTSILPAPLKLSACTDLTLVAAAQRGWDLALDLTRKYGLRSLNVTSFGLSRDLTYVAESVAADMAPMSSLTILCTDDGETYRREISPVVTEALKHLAYDRAAIKEIVSQALGSQSLENANAINFLTLKEAGLDQAALERIEDYLPNVNSIQLAVTPWIIGGDYCRKILKINAAELVDPQFNLLQHLGFTTKDIVAANLSVYGYRIMSGITGLRSQHYGVFATDSELPPEAKIRMAAAVQSFISNDVAAHISLSAAMPVDKIEKIFLEAWRQGLKSITVQFDADTDIHSVASDVAATKTLRKAARKVRSAFLHTQKPHSLPERKVRAKASSRLVSSKAKARKSAEKIKH